MKTYQLNADALPLLSEQERLKREASFERWCKFYEVLSLCLPWMVGVVLTMFFVALVNILIMSAIIFFV